MSVCYRLGLRVDPLLPGTLEPVSWLYSSRSGNA